MLTHFSAKEQVKRLVHWSYHFFLYTILLWIVYNILLSPVWGNYIYSISEEILKRKEFLDSRGAYTSPSLNSFKNIPLTTSWAVGSIYGFFLINLPIALFTAFWESVFTILKNKRSFFILRIIYYALFLLLFYETLSLFSTPLILCYGICITLLVPIVLSKLIRGIHFYANITNTAKSKVWCFILILFFISPWLTHPVWDIIQINPQKYEGINQTTLFRDWLLLDKNGHSSVNEWYYNNTVYASESDKITVFQPLVVGYVNLNMSYWKRVFYSYFASETKGVSGQPILFIKLPDIKGAHQNLKNNFIDYLALDAKKYYDTHKLLGEINSNSYGFFDYQKDDKLVNVNNYYYPQNYFGEKQIWNNKNIASTPLTRITSTIRYEGYNPKRNNIVRQYRYFLKTLLSSHVLFYCILLPMLSCLIYFLFTLVCLTFQITPWIYIILIAATALPILKNINHNINFWNAPLTEISESSCIEKQLYSLHKASREITPEKTKQLLNSSLNDDKRIAMWQINVLGNAHFKAKQHDKKDIEKWLLTKISSYEMWPLNVRYKYIEACSKIPNLHAYVENLLSKEKHLYIRWYGEHFGFGKDDMNHL